MSAARAKRHWMRWQRYVLRHPGAGPRHFAFYTGYVNAHAKVAETGRYAPIGIRSPYMLRSHR